MINRDIAKKIKILFVIEQHSISYKYYEQILIELKELGHFETEVFNLVSSEKVNQHLKQYCSAIYTFDPRKSYKRQILTARNIIQKAKPDIVHAHEVIPAFYASLGLTLSCSRAKLIFHRHHSFYRNRATKFMERIAFWRSNLSICVSKTMREKTITEHPLAMKKIIYLYNGIKIEDSSNPILFKFDKYCGYHKILLLARLRSGKGHHIAIAAIEIIQKRFPNIVLFFAGDGELKTELNKVIVQKGLAENIILLGDVNNIRALFSNIDISILPSESEAFNLSILETFASKKLSIASNLPSIKECIVDGKTGVLIEPNNAQSLAEKIIYYIENKALREEIAYNGYELYCREYTTKRMVNKLEEVYLKVYDN